MTLPVGAISDEEQRRLDECIREPIRTPGSIQPHGALLAVDVQTFTVEYATENCSAILGTEAAEMLGKPLADLTGPEWVQELRELFEDSPGPLLALAATLNGSSFDGIVHWSEELVLIEFEPALGASSYQAVTAVYGVSHQLTKATSKEKLWAGLAKELRTLTRFDRVMIYHFHPDGHGEVVAEDRAEDMEPYLGLHFPASDIPAQARELYLTKLSRMIVNSSGETSAILSNPDGDGAPLDLSLAELRSVSPYHLQFMRNMGQASTLSLSLVHNGALIGMATLASRTPHRVSFVLRQGLEVLANQVSLQLNSITEIERLTRQMQLRSVRARLVEQLLVEEVTQSPQVETAIFDGELSVLDLIPADGAVLRLNGATTTIGTTPSPATINALFEKAMAITGGSTFSSDALAHEHPALAALTPEVAGLLMVPFGGAGSFLAWFRPEITQTINWLGDQGTQNRSTPLSPRTSFSSWSQSVSGRARPWDGVAADAEELSRDLMSALFRQAEAKLANLALHDPLTGLPNRRLLMDRMDQGLARYARGVEMALLFIDLDGFKAINDDLGHDTGDALLVHSAKQLLGTVRAQDTVARIGGDEFVVLCEDTSPEEADVVAGRIVDSIRQPFTVGTNTITITASVGVAGANFSFDSTELLRQADAAMYRAKSRGRDQASR